MNEIAHTREAEITDRMIREVMKWKTLKTRPEGKPEEKWKYQVLEDIKN